MIYLGGGLGIGGSETGVSRTPGLALWTMFIISFAGDAACACEAPGPAGLETRPLFLGQWPVAKLLVVDATLRADNSECM